MLIATAQAAAGTVLVPVSALRAWRGAPIEVDARLAVFDLRPGEPQPTLQ